MSEIGIPPELSLFQVEKTAKEPDIDGIYVHRIFDMVYLAKCARPRKSLEAVPVENSIPHRYAGEDSVAQRTNAVRSVLSTGILPPYRSAPTFSDYELPISREQPTINLHLFCEMGAYAFLDPKHVAKLYATATWRPSGGEAVRIILHPLDDNPTYQSLRGSESYNSLSDNSSEITLNPVDNDPQRQEKVFDLYRKSLTQKSPAPRSPTIEMTEDLLLKNPLTDVVKAVKEIERQTSSGSNLYAFITSQEADFGDENQEMIVNWFGIGNNQEIESARSAINQTGVIPIASFGNQFYILTPMT